jgi:Mn2+/Fe2+ NRAMP family transporter
MVPDTPLAISVLNKDRYIVADTEEAHYSRKVKLHRAKTDLVISLVVTGVITCSIMICSAAVLKPQGITITSAADMAIQLTPLLGKFAGILFSLGLWGAAFSSGAYRIKLLPEYCDYAWGIDPKEHVGLNRALIIVGAVVPLLLVVIFGGAPVPMIIVSQATLGILLPFIALVLWILLNKKSFMGEARNNIFKNIMFAILFGLTLFLALRTGINIIATLAG